MNPDYTIADAGQGLRAGQKAAWGDKPCHGDVFHISHQCEVLANTLANVARGAKSRRQKLQAKAGKVRQRVPDIDYRVELARQAEAQAHALARDIRTLTAWLSHDVLALAGPSLVTRRDLFDFIVAQLGRREHEDPRRIRPVRTALQNQRDDLLAFAGVLDDKLIGIAQAHGLPEHLVRAACSCTASRAHRPRTGKDGIGYAPGCGASSTQSLTPWRRPWRTSRSSALAKNLNSRLRNYFTLRRPLGGSYLSLLQFFLNHRCFLRSRRPERVGKSPSQLMTGQNHPHWLTLLGFGPLQPQRA